MKKLIVALIALTALAVVAGCKKETTGTMLKASIGQHKSGYSKTSLVPISDTEAEIHWTMGDQILVNNGTDSQVFTLYDGANSKTGIFNCQEDYTFGNDNVAVYPAANAAISGTTVSLTLPATQTLTGVGTFGNGANPMACTFSNPNSLTFTSLCGVLGLSLTGNNVAITGIEVVSKKEEKLNGAFEADCTANEPTLTATTNNTGTNRVMLECTTTLTTEAKHFYIVLPVGTLSEGFTMNVYNGDTTPIFSTGTDNAITIVWNMVNMMPSLEVTSNEHAYVDLGLPSGLLWATCNIGADTPEAYGDYFAWGETSPKDTYSWGTYQYCNGSYYTMTKYCQNSEYGYNGFTDNLTTLESGDDAATANWGNGWRMPTKEEFEELYNNTTVTWTQQGGVNGRLFTATNGNSLFLPAAGYRSNSNLYVAGSDGYYWSSSLNTVTPNYAWSLDFDSDSYYMSYFSSRYYGLSVRPVREASTPGSSGGTNNMGYGSGYGW